jgi:hypothetical protein
MPDANWTKNAPGSQKRDDPARGLDTPDRKKPVENPAHGTHKDMNDAARDEGEPELQDQPASQSEARDPGADDPRFDH